MSGSLSSFLSGSPVPPQPTGTDTSQNFPSWLQTFVYNAANAASNLASQPYQGFSGQQVATPSADTQAAQNLARGNVGDYTGALNAGIGLTNAASAPISGADISRYMSPYTDQVIGGLTSASNKNLFDNVLPGIQDRFVSAGQSRSPQEAHLTNEALYNSQQALNQGIAGALGQGYQGALNTALQEQGVQQSTGAQLGQLGALTQQLGAGDVGSLSASGQQQDTTNQANINAAMNNFYQQQQWPYQNLGFASNVIRGLPINTNTQTVGLSPPSSNSYSASPLSSFVGTTLGATALQNGNNTGSALSLKRGGRVRPMGALSHLKMAS